LTVHAAAVAASPLNDIKLVELDAPVSVHTPYGAGVMVSAPTQSKSKNWMTVRVGGATVRVSVTVIVVEGAGAVVVEAVTPRQEHALEYPTLPEHADA
jgi:hypothetical protein